MHTHPIKLSKVGKLPDESCYTRSLTDSVLQLIWREQKISRAEIARHLGLSRSTVTEIVRDLFKTGLVVEAHPGKARGGRPPILLQFRDEAGLILGVDIGATHIAVALTDLRGRLLNWQEVHHATRFDPEGTLEKALALCEASLDTQKQGKKKLTRIGVAVPAPIKFTDPEWHSEILIPTWRGKSILPQLQQHFGVPVHVDNDANLGALAEHWWGSGHSVDDLVYIKLGYGIGAGYILRGEVYRGAEGFAGEFGHIVIDRHGPPCTCGQQGCLVTYIGGRALEERAHALLPEYPHSMLQKAEITATAIENAAQAGDALALRIVREAADHLAVAVSSWCNLMNPGKIVLGGGLARLGALLLEPLRERVRNSLYVKSQTVEISLSELGPRAVAIGAATLALKTTFRQGISNLKRIAASN